jgi:hypothetical protein
MTCLIHIPFILFHFRGTPAPVLAYAQVYADGSSMTANTEYNQLGPLLEALGKGGDQPDPQTGFSPFPVG